MIKSSIGFNHCFLRELQSGAPLCTMTIKQLEQFEP